MSKSPITPNTPNSAKRSLFRMFSRQNLKKEKKVGAVPMHIAVPLPQTPPQFDFPNRSNRTYPSNPTGQKFPPKLRVNVQLERAPNFQPRTTVREKFANPSTVSTKPRHDPSPSVQSLHNLHEGKVQNTSHNTHFTTQQLPNLRHKRQLGGDLKDLQMYLQNITPSPSAIDVRPPINASSDNFTRDIDVDEGSSVLGSPSSSSYSSDDDDESIQMTTAGITLDDYPWYFIEVVDDDSLLYGLSPIAFHHFGDLKEKYKFEN